MKTLLALLALLLPIGAFGQPILRNSATTNNPAKIFVSFPGPGVNGTVANPVFADSTNVLWQLDGSLTDVHLHLTNLPGTDAAAPINNFYSTNIFVQNGSHNTMIISNSLTIQPVKTNLLATTSTGLVTNANYGTGISWDPTTRTLSATATGGGLSTHVTTLTWSGTNAQGFNASTNGETFIITLTNNVLFGTSTFSNLPNKDEYKTFALGLQQDSTGGRIVTFTNSVVSWALGVPAFIETNSSAVSMVYFHTHPFTNSMLIATPNVDIR